MACVVPAPQVLSLSCPMTDASQLACWAPWVEAVQQPDGSWATEERSWLPRALRVDCWPEEERVVVEEAQAAHELPEALPGARR